LDYFKTKVQEECRRERNDYNQFPKKEGRFADDRKANMSVKLTKTATASLKQTPLLHHAYIFPHISIWTFAIRFSLNHPFTSLYLNKPFKGN